MDEPCRYLQAIAPLALPDAWQVAVNVHKRRKRIGFEVGVGGQVTILVPPDADPELVVAAIRLNRYSIATSVREMKHVGPDPVKELVGGETYELLGSTYHLELSDVGAPAIDGDRLVVPDGPADQKCRAIVALYRRAGLAWMRREGAPYEASGRIAPGLSYAVRDYDRRTPGAVRRQLGKYQQNEHQVTLHWAIFGFPTALIKYVLVHELTHATEPPGTPHGREFQHQLTVWMPDWRKRARALKPAAREAWFGAYPQAITARLT